MTSPALIGGVGRALACRRPTPGNPLLDWISNTLLALVQAERRVDPFFRPAVRRALARSAVRVVDQT